MLSAVSSLIVEDLGEHSLYPVHGVSEAKNIKPLTVLIEKTPRRLNFFSSKQYLAYRYQISDVLSGNSDPINTIGVTSTHIPAYDRERDLTVGVGGKFSLEIFKAIPSLKADATAAGGISIKIKTGGFTLKNIDESAFEKAMRGRTVEKHHAFIKAFFKKPRCRFSVITTVLETVHETVIECSSKHGGHAAIDAKIGTQGGSLNVDVSSSKTGTLTLDAGTVLACQWQLMNVDKTTGEIFPDYQLSRRSNDSFNIPVVLQAAVLPEPEGDVIEVFKNIKWRLSDLNCVGEDIISEFRTAVCNVMNSSSDIQALLDLCDDMDGDLQAFRNQLQNSDACWSLLELIGYKLQDNNIVITSDGPFCKLMPAVLESLSLFDVEDLEIIRKCDAYQKKEILRIIIAAMNNQTSITIDSNLIQQIQKEPVENVFAVMDFEIYLLKGEVSPPKKSCVLEAMFYLLKCL